MEHQAEHQVIRTGGKGRRIRRGGAAALLLGGAALALTPALAGATTGTGSSQVVTFTPSALLSIAASPVSLGTSQTPASLTGINLNSVVVTDSEADSTDWSASVAASNCFLPSSGLPSQFANLSSSASMLPASAITYHAGTGSSSPTVSLDSVSNNISKATLGGTNVFSNPSSTGTLSSPTFGTAVTVASTTVTNSDALSNDGTYTVAPTMDLALSGTGFLAVAQLYTCTLQYTVVG